MKRLRFTGVLWTVGTVVATSSAALAAPQVNTRRFQPTPVLSPYLSLDGSQALGDGNFGIAALGVFEKRPVVYQREDERTADLIGERWSSDLTLSLGFAPILDFGLDIPLVLSQSGSGAQASDELPSFAVGDPAMAVKLMVLEKARFPFGLALVGHATLPVGDSEALAGEPNSTLAGRLVIEFPRGSRLDYVVNLGYRTRQQTRFEEVTLDDELTLGLGVSARVFTRLALLAEVHVAARADAPFAHPEETPGHVEGGARLRLFDQLHLVAGVGAGILPGYGSPAWRAFGGLEFSPGLHDWDGDAIADQVDDCPNEVGTAAGRGCIDTSSVAGTTSDRAEDTIAKRPGLDADEDTVPDADEDTVPDANDQCPLIAEDRDRFRDDDGCPELDNDLDLLADAYDADPMAPEDWDGHEDEDGVPEYDNDLDGVADGRDRCPNERGGGESGCPGDGDQALTSTGGVPDPGEGGPLLLGTTLYPRGPVIFEYAEPQLSPDGEAELEVVARYLAQRGELGMVEVGVHVDGLGPDAWKQWLSQARADVAMGTLVRNGVPPSRLISRGYGKSMPVADNTTPQGRFQNRRVEFRLIDITEAGPSAINAGPSAINAGPRPLRPTHGLTHGQAAYAPSPEGRRLRVIRPISPIKFKYGAGEVAEASYDEVRAVAAELNARPEYGSVEVAVHTDGQGDPGAKLKLSRARAERLMEALVSAGVPARRLVARGFGGMVPIADDATADGRRRNRRVELTVLADKPRATKKARAAKLPEPPPGDEGLEGPELPESDDDGQTPKPPAPVEETGGGHEGGHSTRRSTLSTLGPQAVADSAGGAP